MIVIYKIKSPNSKIYIGQTVNLKARIKRYSELRCKSQKHLYNSLVKHEFKNHNIDVLKEFQFMPSQKLLDLYEIKFIKDFKSKGFEMLNLTDGGKGCRGYKFTDEDKAKLSKSLMNKVVTKETKNKMSSYSKNRKKSHKLNIAKALFKPVLQYDLNGNFIKEWESLKASTQNNYGDIRSCINGRQKTAGGFIWKYKLISKKTLADLKLMPKDKDGYIIF